MIILEMLQVQVETKEHAKSFDLIRINLIIKAY